MSLQWLHTKELVALNLIMFIYVSWSPNTKFPFNLIYFVSYLEFSFNLSVQMFRLANNYDIYYIYIQPTRVWIFSFFYLQFFTIWLFLNFNNWLFKTPYKYKAVTHRKFTSPFYIRRIFKFLIPIKIKLKNHNFYLYIKKVICITLKIIYFFSFKW